MDKEDEHSPSEFYCAEDLETFDVETETDTTECHIIDNFARSVLPRPRANIPYSIRSSCSVSKRLVFCSISEEVTSMGSYCFCRCCAPGHFNFMFWVRF